MKEGLRFLLIVDPRVISAQLLPESFNSWSTVYSYYITRELMRMGNVVEFENVYEIIKGKAPRLDSKKFDYALIILNNASKNYGEILFNNIRIFLNPKGIIGTISDHDHGIEHEDVRFCATLIDPNKIDSRTHQVLWGCDPEVLEPKKERNCLNIFLDSWTFTEKKYDRTPELLESCLRYSAHNTEYIGGKKNIKILGWGKTGVEEFTESGKNDIVLKPVRVGFEEMMSHLRKADIFVVTHSESMGLTILEAAMAGCIVLIPVPAKPNPSVTRWIKSDLAETIPHIEVPHRKEESIEIPWEKIENKLLPDKIRSETIHLTWKRVTEKIIEGFIEKNNFINEELSSKMEVIQRVGETNHDLRNRMLISVKMCTWPENKKIRDEYYENWGTKI